MTIEESHAIIEKFIEYRTLAEKNQSPQDIQKFKKYERECIEKFQYLVLMKVARYRNFHNYEDLLQEGLDALTRGMKTYKRERGNLFWWLHKYIDTRISRCANLHTTIRFPLRYARQVTPRRESIIPTMNLVDISRSPQDNAESREVLSKLGKQIPHLSSEQQRLISLVYEDTGEGAGSITRACERMGISRPACIKMLNTIFATLKQHI